MSIIVKRSRRHVAVSIRFYFPVLIHRCRLLCNFAATALRVLYEHPMSILLFMSRFWFPMSARAASRRRWAARTARRAACFAAGAALFARARAPVYLLPPFKLDMRPSPTSLHEKEDFHTLCTRFSLMLTFIVAFTCNIMCVFLHAPHILHLCLL